MRKTKLIIVFLIFLTLVALAQERSEFGQWLVYGPRSVSMPAFSDQKDVNNHPFDAASLQAGLYFDERYGNAGDWRTLKTVAGILTLSGGPGYHLHVLKAYIQTGRWTKGALLLTMKGLLEVELDGQSVFSRKNSADKEERIEMALTQGKHQLVVKNLSDEAQLTVRAAFEADKEFSSCRLVNGTDPYRTLTVNDVLEGEKLDAARISPSGRYLLLEYREIVAGSGKSKKHTVIYDLDARRNLFLLRNGEMGNFDWLPRSDKLSYTVSFDGADDLYVYDLSNNRERKIATGLKNLSQYFWAPSEDRIVFSRYCEADKPGELKRVYGVEDRLPYFRNRSSLHLIEVGSGLVTALSAGNLSADFHDFSPDGRCILFSTQRMDYSQVPFHKQNLYEMDLTSGKLKIVWQDKLHDGYAQYSPDGHTLLVSGGPECFGELGVKVRAGRIPNSSDGQIYLYDTRNGKVEPVSRDFDPAIDRAHWSQDGNIYLQVTEKDYGRLYRFNPKSRLYQLIPLPVEVLDRIDFDLEGKRAAFNGSGVSMPDKLYLVDLKTGRSQLIAFPGQEKYSLVRFGKCDDWDFVNKKGDTISGRVYFPPDYRAGEKYPLIVNFYGGTSPVERSFGGRYPIETWAAAGYIVYVMQPSGATGFGQDFSALHVNGWGYDAIDDIIDSTRAFLAAHPMVDAKNVGCIGASYGGFTTMLIQTRTDIFKTAISHAGISSITSYWGEGYWGYSYNTTAARNSYPWNRRDIFVENSPIYNADKFQNSILLLHGQADTNVPVGESLQYYAALKLLGKNAELVLVEGQNHWIVDYGKRVKWHHTIMSWFDKMLKDQPQQWNDLYPEKNY